MAKNDSPLAPEDTRRLFLVLSYVGTRFSGFQLQTNGRTVQGELEAALAQLTGVFTRVHGSGRTDAGVHARAQTAHADVHLPAKPIRWLRSLNAVLPDDITVREAYFVRPDFHTRFDAVGKTYAYRLWPQRYAIPPELRPYVWATGPLNEAAMLEAAAHLTGRHDFASFQNRGTDITDTTRTLHLITRRDEPYLDAPDARHPACFAAPPATSEERSTLWEFSADGFLKQMVRNLMGLLVATGMGKIAPDAVPGILAARKRPGYIPTAPARGLTLLRVYYPEIPVDE